MKKNSILLFIVGAMLCLSCEQSGEFVARSSDGLSISYRVEGSGQPALVFVHGWCCDRSYWDEQVLPFSQIYKVVTIDLGGHGDSGLDREEWTLKNFADDVVAVVKKEKLKQVILIGHSMGGQVILEAAVKLKKRVIGIVGVDTYQDLSLCLSDEQVNSYLTPFQKNFSEAAQRIVRSMFHVQTDSVLANRIVSDMSGAPPEVGIGAMRSHFSNDPAETLKKVKVPVVAINSNRYPVNLEENRALLTSFNVKIMRDVGHFVMLEDSFQFNSLLEETIRELIGKKEYAD